MDPADINTLDQLAGALDQLRRDRALSLRGVAEAAARLPKRHGRQPALPRSTTSHLLNAKSVPEVETVVTYLGACGVHGEQAQRAWLLALERVAHQHQRRPPGAVRVRDARPRLLGVHAAIQVEQSTGHSRNGRGPGDELPPYVPRDCDADLRTKLTVAGQRGGFVLLVGESSVGKSRALFEAVRAVLPDWWLLHPRDAAELRELSFQSSGRIVVWLDELQDYLDHPGGVPAGQVRGLIEAGAVLVATCWPDEQSERAALPVKDQPDPYANDRRLLDLADILAVSKAFSIDELRRAENLAATDRRIRVALDTPDAGFTQVMAGGPELIRQWDHAPAYAREVITAALDARRVGAHAPLTPDYFADAVPGYLNDRQVATAPADWLDNALEYATTLLHGATATLTPVPAGMGRIAGYRVADYLYQHALRVRRTEHLPDTAWQALIRHHHPDDTQRLADNAERRGREHEAVLLYIQLTNYGNKQAAIRLRDMVVGRGHVDDALQVLRTRADSGDEYSAFRLADLLADQGQVEELRTRADGNDEHAAIRLANLLADQGQVEELRTRADGNDKYAAIRLANLLVKRGQVDDALQVLRTRASRGDERATFRLANLLVDQGQVDDALQVLRTRASSGDERAAILLVDLLVKRGQVDNALQVLRTLADRGNSYAATSLVNLLVEQRQDVELEREVAAGTGGAFTALRRSRAEQRHAASNS